MTTLATREPIRDGPHETDQFWSERELRASSASVGLKAGSEARIQDQRCDADVPRPTASTFPTRTRGALLDLTDEDVLAGAHGSAVFRDESFRRFMSLAIGLTHRFKGKGVADADLQQVAFIGLLNAIDRYQPELGPFKPFAIVTIRGVLKRQLRDEAWSVRVPRRLQERSLLVANAMQSLSQSLGRAVDAKDIAAGLSISEEEVVEAITASFAYQSQSIDAPAEGTGRTLADVLHDREWTARSAEWEALAEGIRALPAREQELLCLRFFREMTQSEIAEAMGISQVHVSRLLSRATDRLRYLVA